ncbi:MAG: metalloregulator ArsR/SmtB family transcription factor [Bacteroidales bacterium]|nr:metalloregulator ArsR/SmtB family transcription factor [Candidatus Latescibacterota bacterium]
MDDLTRRQYEARARILKALAHPSRLFIVDRLSSKPHCVQDLAGMIEADISTVSRHLSVLRNAGIVKDQKEGTKVFYRLSVPCVLNFFSCVESVMESNVKEQAGLLE